MSEILSAHDDNVSISQRANPCFPWGRNALAQNCARALFLSLVSFCLLQQYVKDRSVCRTLSRGNVSLHHRHRYRPQYMYLSRLFWDINGRFRLPYKDTKNFWNDQIFHAGNEPFFFARFCKFFCFWLPRLHKRHFCHIVTLSHWGYISVRCLLPCRRWPPGSALISPKTLLCHIVTLGHYYGMPPPTPDALQPPTSSPEGGENCWFKA